MWAGPEPRIAPTRAHEQTHDVWKKPEPVFDRDDVNNLLFTMLDIRRELEHIRILLEEADGEEDDA